MAMVANFWTISGLGVELGMDRRAVARALSGVPPDHLKGKTSQWLMKTAIDAIYRGKSGGEEDLDLNEERARLAKEQADRQEMENQARRGELLERADVDAAMIAEITRAKTRILAIPSKLAPAAAQTEDVAEIERLTRSYLSDALMELSNPDDIIATVDPGVVDQSMDATA